MDTYTNIRIESTYDGYIKGGGEILYYLTLEDNTTDRIDWSLVVGFEAVLYMSILATILLAVLGVMLYFKAYNIKFKQYTGIKRSLSNLKSRRNRDSYILNSNRFLSYITSKVENGFLKVGQHNTRLAYDLKRANWTVPGGYRVITVQEYNAIMKFTLMILLIISLVLGILINSILGLLLGIVSIVTCNVLVRQLLSAIVKEKDMDIKIHFSDLYFMVHYVLLSNGKAPLINIFSSYYRSTENKNMKAFVKDCIDIFDLYGEFEGAMVIANEYKEIYEVQKLMKFIRQFNNGGDIKQDLIGFRSELIETKKYMLRMFTNKLAAKAQFAINLIFILVGQTVISVAFIYLEDIFKGF